MKKTNSVKKVLWLLLLLFMTQMTFSETKKFFVTDVKKTSEKEWSITLNDLIIIKEIKVKKTKIGTREIVNLEFPTYISKAGRAYPQVQILSKQLLDKIVTAVSTGKTEELDPKIMPEYKINKFSQFRKSGSTLKIFASVIFENEVEIECKVMEGKRGPWISWPSRKDESTGKWKKQVVFKSKEYRQKIEDELIKKYKTMKTESGADKGEE